MLDSLGLAISRTQQTCRGYPGLAPALRCCATACPPARRAALVALPLRLPVPREGAAAAAVTVGQLLAEAESPCSAVARILELVI